MYQRRPRRFKRHTNGRNRPLGSGMDGQPRMRFNSFSNGQNNNRFHTTQSAEKLFEKYNALAKEALSLGDRSLTENYLQHADHFMRIIESKKRNQNQSTVDNTSNDVGTGTSITSDISEI